MSLKILKIKPWLARVIFVAAGLTSIAATWYFIKLNFANIIASRLDIQRPESKLVADWLTQTSPSDPQTHYGAAVVFEKTLDPADLARSVKEYEMATALSPNDYLLWLALGKARNQSGDPDGALAAFQRALTLAPNYSDVQWVYGNSLIRQDKTDEGFSLIAKAAASKPEYSKPAVSIAFQIFDGDIGRVRQSLGDSDITNAALTSSLADQKRFDDALDAWSKLSAEDKTGKQRQLGLSLTDQLASANKFQLAALVAADLAGDDAEKPVVGQIGNGGFEDGAKLKNAGYFEWHISHGSQPQIGLGEGQSHGGKYNLWLFFNTFETSNFRSVSQIVPVVPGAEYDFEMYYRSDLKTPATLNWEVADAATTFTIARTPPMIPVADWTPLRVRFVVPANTDGVIIRLARDGCSGPSCPMNGKLSLDDFSLGRL